MSRIGMAFGNIWMLKLSDKLLQILESLDSDTNTHSDGEGET